MDPSEEEKVSTGRQAVLLIDFDEEEKVEAIGQELQGPTRRIVTKQHRPREESPMEWSNGCEADIRGGSLSAVQPLATKRTLLWRSSSKEQKSKHRICSALAAKSRISCARLNKIGQWILQFSDKNSMTVVPNVLRVVMVAARVSRQWEWPM